MKNFLFIQVYEHFPEESQKEQNQTVYKRKEEGKNIVILLKQNQEVEKSNIKVDTNKWPGMCVFVFRATFKLSNLISTLTRLCRVM